MQSPYVIPEFIIGSDFLDKVLPIILEAKESVKIVVFDWRIYTAQPHHPVMKFVQALQDAQRRGCTVQVLIRDPHVEQQLRACGFDSKILHRGKLVHAKMMLVDEQIAVIGSHNYTQSGFTANLEISIAIDCGTKFNDLSLYFKNLWSV